ASNFSGTDTFDVRATDSQGAQSNATVTMTIAPVNDAPTIREDVITASGVNPLIDVLANDTDPDGEALTLTLVGAPDFGTAAVENGRIRLTLPAGFQGFDTFSYRAVDAAGSGATVRAVVFMDAQPVRFIYVTNEDGDYAHNIYVDDLLTRRRATSFTGNGPTGMGNWMLTSKNGRTVLFDEEDSSPATLGRRFWTVFPADGSRGPRHINPPLTAGQKIELASELSPDGRWVAYRITHPTDDTRFYLADLVGSDAPREILPPTGTSRIDTFSGFIEFNEQSQYLYIPVTELLPGGARGMTIYRAPVSNPSAMEPLFPPAVADRATYPAYESPDGSRAIVIVREPAGASLYLARAGDPTHPLPLSPIVPDSLVMGSYRADWDHNRLLFNIDSPTGSTPYTSTLHVADLATGAWTALGNLPAAVIGPELEDVHPDGGSVLISTYDEVREVDLVAGAPSRLFYRSNEYQGPRYTNAGTAVLFVRIGGDAQVFSRNDPSQPKSLFTAGCASNYRASPDGKTLSASGADSCSASHNDSIWAFNQTTGAGTYAKRLVQVTNPNLSFTYVSVGEIVPRF
ncbi:MAG TPA: Ig-like domain-containing protein, partial [Povalibacter sp.]|nr:Ig-like domain-containing protein [Povalibacter sp.]